MGFKRTSAPPSSSSSSSKRKRGAKRAKSQKKDDNAYQEKRRFKFQTYAQQLENISVEHFQKRAGFVGMKPAEHSSWFHASVLAWRDSNLTTAFAGLCNELEMLMRSGTVAQVLLVKEELVQALLTAIEKDLKKSATIVFSHLLAMLAKDLGEELFDQFIPIWKALSRALIDCEDAEVSEAVINCQMFFLRRFIELLIEEVHKYSKIFLDGLLETTNNALRRTAANTLAYYFCKCELESVKSFLDSLVWDKKKIHAVGEALILAASKQVELVKAAFANTNLAFYVCIKVLLNAQEPEDVWKSILECQPSINLLNYCVALRKGYKVKFHSKILEKVSGSTVEEALLLALLIKSCDLPTLLSIRTCVQEKLNVVNKNALVLFLEELGFNLWQGFSGLNIPVDSWLAKNADCLVKPTLSIQGNSFERRLLESILQKDQEIIRELVDCNNSAAILYFDSSLPRDYLLLSLASQNIKVIEKSLEKFETPLAKKLLVITQVPATLERFREKINLITALERDLEQLCDGEYEELFWYLLGACHIKLSLVMPAVSKLLNQAAARKPKIWAAVYSSFISYISDKARDNEIYDVQMAPEITKEKSILVDDNLEKLPCLLKRVEIITSDSSVQFGELFCKNVAELEYSLTSPSSFGNVLSILAKAPAACNPVNLNKLIVLEDNYNTAFRKSVQLHFVDLLIAYSKSSSIRNEPLMSLVSMGDEQIQLRALECLSSANAEYSPIVDILKPILNEKTWREHLAILTMQRNEVLFSNYLWPTILKEVTIRVLYGRLIARKLAKNKSAMQVRRKAILGFVAAWPATDLECFVAFTRSNLKMDASIVLGYFSLLEYVIRYLPLTMNCVNDTFDMILSLLNSWDSEKRVRSLGMKRMLELLAKHDTFVDTERQIQLFDLLKPLIEKLSTEYMQNESSLVEILALLAIDDRYSKVFCNSVVADSLVKCLAVNPRNKVFLKVLVILENVLSKVTLKRILIEGLMQKVQLFAGLLSRSTQEIFSQLVRLIMLVAQEQKESIIDVDALKRALLPLLKLKKVPIGVKCDVCRAAGGLFAESTTCGEEYFKVLCALTIGNTDISLRCTLIELLGAMSINSRNYSTCFTLLQELFSMMHGMLEEADYDRRFRCFSDIRSGSFVLDINSRTLLAHICLYYVLNEPNELSMRNQSMLHLQENIESIIDLYLEYLSLAFKSEHEIVRLDYCSLLGKAVPVSEKLKDLVPLLHGGDEEAEVFGNLAHLQQHRKIRAIRRLCNGMPTGHFMAQHFVSFMLAWAVPLPNTPSNPALQQEAAKAVGELGGKCTPRQAQLRLDQLLTLVEKDAGKEKAVLKVVPFVLEHMPLGEGTVGLVPKLMNLMRQKSNSTELIRIPIAIAVAQLLVRLGKINEYLPAILSALITSLKSKLEDTRREARDALQSVFRILSNSNNCLASVIESFIREIRAVMEPGYQRHVMIFTINHILTPLIPSLQVSDTLFELIVDCLEEDLFGRLAKERDTSEWTGKVLEAKSCRGFDLLGAFAKTASLERLARIQERFRPLGQRNVRNLEKLLNVLLNAFDRTELLSFVINLSNPNFYFVGEEKYQEDAKWQLLGLKSAVLLIKRVSTDQSLPEEYVSGGEALKTISFGHLYGTHSSLMMAALRFICYSLKWICWTEEEKRQVLLRCFELVVKSAGNGELVSECFKYVALVVRDHPQVRVSDQQLKALLTHTRAHLEDLERQQLTFSLLKSVLSRAVATEHYPLELYELMGDVARSMVTSHHAVTRQHCRYLMAQFLAECPLSAQKFEEHFERILTDSANYIHLSGRNSCRELLIVLLKRQLIKEEGEGMRRLFLILTGSYAQESEVEGLEMIDKVIKEMMLGMQQVLGIVNEMLKKWLASGQPRIIQAAQRALRVIHSVTNGKGLNKSLLKHLQ